MQTAQVPEEELHKEYQEEIDSFRTPERVRVRHILIKTQGKPKEEAPVLRQKAEQILKMLQNGGNFGELAKKYSEDTGSAEKGGELGWVTHGQMVPNFEKACFSLKPGRIERHSGDRIRLSHCASGGETGRAYANLRRSAATVAAGSKEAGSGGDASQEHGFGARGGFEEPRRRQQRLRRSTD